MRRCLGCGDYIASGSYHPRCKPRPFEPERLRGRRWMAIRTGILRRAGGICEDCGERVAEQVHHLDHDVTNNALSNLRAVCRPCHAKAGRFRT
jgi:5-methylcytosine-specific restriction endonuclease McrA